MNKMWRRKQKARAHLRKLRRAVNDRLKHYDRQGYSVVSESDLADLIKRYGRNL